VASGPLGAAVRSVNRDQMSDDSNRAAETAADVVADGVAAAGLPAGAAEELRDRALLATVAGGGTAGMAALEALFRRYRGPLLGFLQRRGVPPEQADDLVQDTFLRVARSAASFRQEARLSSWLFRIALNLHIDQLRRTRPETQLDEAGWGVIEQVLAVPADQCGPGIARDDVVDCFERGFAQFAGAFPQRAEVLRQVALQGWAIRDVAALLERTEGATREFLSQSRKKLRSFLETCRELLDAD